MNQALAFIEMRLAVGGTQSALLAWAEAGKCPKCGEGDLTE